MLRTTSAVLMLAYGLLLASVAYAEDFQAALTDQYRDKILALRHSFKSGNQEYAADGTPTKADEEGTWTIYGRMVVDKIKVDADRLKVEGKRVIYSFDRFGKPVRFQEDSKHPAESLSITLHMERPLASVDEADAILGRVFALTPEAMVDSVPDYWKPALANQLGLRDWKPAGSSQGLQTGEKPLQQSDFADQHVSPPRVLYQREPDYSDAARERRLQGVVALNIIVDNTGTVRKVNIIRPLGMGLDENAMSTISTWKFTPAKKDGQPMAAALYIEVSFNLQ